MSRWKQEFEKHPFHATWNQLKNSTLEAKVDDETIVTTVSELARFKKVVEYLDELIKTVEPELVPIATWTNSNSQAVPCLQNLNAYNTGRNPAHLVQANAHIDNLLTYIRPYMVLPKEAAASIKRASTIYAKTAEQYIESFQAKSNSLVQKIKDSTLHADEQLSKINLVATSINDYGNKLFGGDGHTGIKKSIEDLSSDLDVKTKVIQEFYDDIIIGSETQIPIKAEVLATKKSILETDSSIQKIATVATETVKDLKQFHTKIFGQLNGENLREGGLDEELNIQKERLSEFEEKQKIQYKALNDEIEGLLPGATSAGLATSYRSLRRSFSKPIKLYSKLFYASITVLFLLSSIFIIDDIGFWHIKLIDTSKATTVATSLLFKLPLLLPILWLAIFASKRRSEAQRLQQEYAHKEAIAKSYQSFKKQIDELNDDKNTLINLLLESAIKAISYNASESLDGKHGDKMPAQEVFQAAVDAAAKLQKVS